MPITNATTPIVAKVRPIKITIELGMGFGSCIDTSLTFNPTRYLMSGLTLPAIYEDIFRLTVFETFMKSTSK
jgi:hypothetical protein